MGAWLGSTALFPLLPGPTRSTPEPPSPCRLTNQPTNFSPTHSPSSSDLQYLIRKNMWNTKSKPVLGVEGEGVGWGFCKYQSKLN